MTTTAGRQALRGVAAAIVAAAVGGCAGPGPQGLGATGPAPLAGAPGCAPAVPVKLRNITVTGTTATLTLKDPRSFPAASGAGITWTLDTAGFSFASDGIAFAAPPAGASSTPGTVTWRWCTLAVTPDQSFKYSIRFVADSAPNRVFVCDPTIIGRSTGLVDTDHDPDVTLQCPAQ